MLDTRFEPSSVDWAVVKADEARQMPSRRRRTTSMMRDRPLGDGGGVSSSAQASGAVRVWCCSIASDVRMMEPVLLDPKS